MGPRSPEGKAAKAIIDRLNSFEFADNALAYMLANSNIHVQKRLFHVFMHLVRIWAGRYDAGIMDDSEISMLVNSKRIQEALERYGYVFSESN
jgi:hypothetical protein